MKSFKQLRLEREKQARSEALNRFIASQRDKRADLRAELQASYISFGVTLLLLGISAMGIAKTGGL
jgi:uncharacterized protein with von Willebrand factor type A (vWA) domain